MPDKAVRNAMKQLHIQHNTHGKMLGELDLLIESLDGDALVNAMDDVFRRYNFDIA